MIPATVKLALVTSVLATFVVSCGGSWGMREMHEPSKIEGSFSEMSVPEFYAANCATCHGSNRQGGIGPPLVPSRLTQSDDFYAETIADGRSGTSMPAWSEMGLSDLEIDSLVAFLRTEP